MTGFTRVPSPFRPSGSAELAVLAGMLEQTDQSFTRIQAGLRTYAASYGAY